jgi:dienelactone hydrolase
MSLAFTDELFDAQLVRTLAYVSAGGAELGECMETARRIGKADAERWVSEWTATADRVRTQADASQAAGRRISARNAYLRASNYYRTAGLFLLQSPVEDRLRATVRAQTETFRSAAALFDLPPDVIRVPYENTALPGYFFRAAADGSPRPTMILTDGYDGTVEELYFSSAAAALSRGYNVLAFDGPGQGSVLLDQGLPFRPDWEAVVTPVVDYALTLPEVDPDRIVLHGWSFGGYLAPRAATAEHRLAACISDCGPYDLLDATMGKVPAILATGYRSGNSLARRVLDRAMTARLKHPSGGWALRRNLWVHDVAGPMAFLALAAEFTLKGREQLIRCPTFVAATQGDDLSAGARTFADKLVCPRDYVSFTAADGVTGHCEMSGRSVFHARMFDWLDGVLEGPAGPSTPP